MSCFKEQNYGVNKLRYKQLKNQPKLSVNWRMHWRAALGSQNLMEPVKRSLFTILVALLGLIFVPSVALMKSPNVTILFRIPYTYYRINVFL
jgi:hypothetical protein